MPQIIAVCNAKGGVGKTTVTFNLGAALAKKYKKKVLLVDLDVQGDLSKLCKHEANEGTTNIMNLFCKLLEQGYIDSSDVKKAIYRNKKNGFDYIAGTDDLSNLGDIIPKDALAVPFLPQILSHDVVADYDYVLIDCLPTEGVCLGNAFMTADSLLVVVNADYLSPAGIFNIYKLKAVIEDIQGRKISVLGAVVNAAYEKRKLYKALINSLEINEYEGGEKLHVFHAVIPNSVEVIENSQKGKSMVLTNHKTGESYKALAKEVIGRCEK